MIPYGHQNIDQSDIDEVVKVLKSDWLTQGPMVDNFEKKVAEYCGSKYSVAVSSGTAALHAAYAAAGVGEGDEVIMPANTFAATANAALYLGARPVFCDIRMDTYNIDEEKIAELITEKIKAIAPVHFAGHPCELDKILNIARKYNLIVVEDACHALGAIYKDKKVGSISDLTAFSFHPVKLITTGEGGVVCTTNRDYFEKMKIFRTHGITKDPARLEKNDGPWYHEMQMLGFNYRITDIQCALGASQLRKLDNFLACRRKIVDFYNENLKDIEGLILPTELAGVRSAWHLYVVRVPTIQRKKIFEDLHAAGIGAQVHYIPVNHHPYYRRLGYNNSLKNTEEYYASCISLPIYPGLKTNQLEFIAEELRKIFNKF